MPFTFRTSEKLVAAFLVIGFLLFIVIVILIGRGSEVFSFKNTYYCMLNETYGFTSGSQIKYKGIDVGKIRRVILDENENIRVEFYILNKYRRLIRENTVLKIQPTLLGGSSFILIPSLDRMDNILPPGSRVFSSDDEEGKMILKRFESQGPKKEDLTETAKRILDNIDSLKPLINTTVANVRDITSSLKVIANNIKELSYELNSPSNTIGGLVKDRGRLESKIDSIVSSLDKTLSNVKEISGKLQNSPDDIKYTVLLLQENLIELKKVLGGIKRILGDDKKEMAPVSSGIGERE